MNPGILSPRRAIALAACWLTTLVVPGATIAADARPEKPVFWVIPHTHWEGAVFSTREEYLEEGLTHILSAVRLLKEHPSYRFALDQVAYFRPFLERYPEEAEAFKRFVAEGRLQIVCGLNVMPDDNMPSGESFVRQMLYAKGYVWETLGTEVKTGWLLDTFGHHDQLPQILRLAGYESFWFSRGVADRATMPSEFLWQGLDGTRIPAFWLPHSYGLVYHPPSDPAKFAQFMIARYHALDTFAKGQLDRVGLDGADVTDPELYLPALVDKFNAQTNQPFTLRIGVPADFEAAVGRRKDLPVITGERNPLFQGIYSTRIELKQRMREAERLLTSAEKFAVLANSAGFRTDDQMTWRAWDPPLFNVTHDLASGVMTDRVYADTVRGYDFSQRLAEEMIAARLEDILSRTDTRGAGIPLAVFNTLGWKRTDIVEGDEGFGEAGVADFDVVDPAGKTVPSQLTSLERYGDGSWRRVKFLFVARDVPALGCAVYHVVPRKSPGELKTGVKISGGNMENEFYHASVDLPTGALTGLRVKSGGWEALKGPANVVAEQTDNGDVWELDHNLDGGQNLIMKRPLPVPQAGQALFSTEAAGPGFIRRGPVFSEYSVQHPLGSNVFTTRIRLYHGIPRVDFETKILNRDRFVRYRLLTPVNAAAGRNFQEIPFGAIERPMSQEFPAQNWMDYSDDRHGLTVLNQAMPGNNVSDGTMMLSLLRSTRIQAYGGLDPANTSDTALELGKELTLHYALMPHEGDWRAAHSYRAGWEFNNPLVVRKTKSHPGTLPGEWNWLEVFPANVVLSACKPAKDGSVVVRVYEADGAPTTGATIKFRAPVSAAHEANLMEDDGKKMSVRKNTLEFNLHPFEIKTFKVKLRNLASGK